MLYLQIHNFEDFVYSGGKLRLPRPPFFYFSSLTLVFNSEGWNKHASYLVCVCWVSEVRVNILIEFLHMSHRLQIPYVWLSHTWNFPERFSKCLLHSPLQGCPGASQWMPVMLLAIHQHGGGMWALSACVWHGVLGLWGEVSGSHTLYPPMADHL